MKTTTRSGIVAVAAAIGLAGCAAPYGGGYNGYQQSGYQPPAYQQPGYQQPGYQQPGYQPPAYPQSGYQGQPAANGVLHGRVESIETIPGANNSPNLLGTLVGGAAGGLLGNQVGGGRGKTAATIGGAVIGAIAGNRIENNMGSPNVLYRVRVRLDDGRIATVTQADPPANVQVGSRVQVANDHVYPY